MYVDDPMLLELIALIKAHGVRHVVISPGSRHYPLVRSLEADSDFHLYSVVDERSAGFFAIGVIRAIDAPVAVLTTSGTAAVNLGSAMADAYYQRLPLVAITADRQPQLLDQMEDQMLNQSVLFADTIRARANLRVIRADIDHWYDNRVLNEALLAMVTNGRGPIHINVPIVSHSKMTYTTASLPAARVVSHHVPTQWGTDWSDVHARLKGKRVMILWGQSNPPDIDILSALDKFTTRTNSLIVADHLGNLHHPAVAPRVFPVLRSGPTSRGELTPDIVITMGGTLFLIEEVKAILGGHEIEHWRVDPDGAVVDPFWQLTDIFQVAIRDFLENATAADTSEVASDYLDAAVAISRSIPAPAEEFGELYAIGQFLRRLPPKTAIHIANSAPMRMAHLFDISSEVKVLGNRGVNGIDGSMSATIGHASASVQPTYLVIGDLSFFYDMNSLGIRDLPAGLRVLLLNNAGGALMQASVPFNLAEQTAVHTSASHANTAQGWVEAVGIDYQAVRSGDELEDALDELFSADRDGPIVVEVFTDRVRDMQQLNSYHALNYALGNTAYLKARAFAGRTLRRLGLRE